MSQPELFCQVDDFCQQTESQWNSQRLSDSEIMTILIYFHQSRYRSFKAYYTQHIQVHLYSEFQQLVCVLTP